MEGCVRMNSFSRLVVKFVALLLPFPLATMIAMSAFPMDFFDSEYGWYLQNQEYAMGHDEYCRVLIMGDSSAKVSLRPELLSEDTYNYSLFGATAIEEYYYLREYLEHNEAPEYLIYMQGPWYLIADQYFWSRSVFFHRISEDDLWDMQARLRELNDLSPLEVSDVEEFRKEVALYRCYAPQKYSVIFLKGLALNLAGSSRRKSNAESIALANENKGQTQYSKGQSGNVPVYIHSDHFSPSDLMEHYFRALIELCAEHHIRFIFQSSPLNESSRSTINHNWLAGYMEYMDGFQADYPDAVFHAELEWYPAEDFSDSFHLNPSGVEKYDRALRERYADIFDPKEIRKSGGEDI